MEKDCYPVVRTAALHRSLELCCTIITEVPLIFSRSLVGLSVGMNQKMKIIFHS